MDKKENTLTNWLTIPTNWTNYLDLHNGVVHYPDGMLSIPKEQLLLNNTSNRDNFNRRIAFLKAEKFPITLDSLELSFKAKRELILNEDCMSFMLQLYDEDYNKFEVYSAHNCDVYNISCSLLMPNGKYDYQDDLEEKKIDEILEDGEWHYFVLHVKDNTVKIEVDSKPIITFKKKVNFKQIREIWFVFEGNGYIDDVVMKNTTTGKMILNDDFNQ